jgi:hypothetical protein
MFRTPQPSPGVLIGVRRKSRQLLRHPSERIHGQQFCGKSKAFDRQLPPPPENVIRESRIRVQAVARDGENFGKIAPLDVERIR